jgi:hypothetical protein
MIGSLVVTMTVFVLIAIGISDGNSSPPSVYSGDVGQGPTEAPSTDFATDTPTEAPSEALSSTAPAADPSAQAAAIGSLLQQANADRQSVTTAVTDLHACGASRGLTTDISDLDQAATARTTLADQASSTDVGVLDGGPAAVQALATALQDSAKADTAFANWGRSLDGHCTSRASTRGGRYKDAMAASAAADTEKAALVAAWNPIAQQYGQTQWQTGDL